MRLTKVFKVRIAVTIIMMASITSASMARSSTVTRPSSPPRQPTAQDCAALCDWNREMRDPHVVIDANTGEIIDGNTRFAEGDKVQVIFVNKNPFKYSYRFSLRSEPLSAAIASAFLGLIFSNLTEFTPKPLGIVGAARVCAPLQTARDLYKNSQDILKELNSFKEAEKAYNTFVKNTEADKIGDCQKICNDADALRELISKLSDIDKLTEKITKLGTDVAQLKAQLPGGCSAAEETGAKDLITEMENNLPNFKKGAEEAKKIIDQMKKAAGVIQAAFASGHPFYEIRYPQTAGGPTGVHITICRTNLRIENAKEECLTPIDLQVGESPLSLSAGIGFSTIPDQRIIRQSGLVPDGMNGTKLANVFGRENNSSFKPSGVVMLNGHLIQTQPRFLKDLTFAASAGLVVTNRNDSTELEFIVGPSLGFLRNTLFTTFGFHAGRVENLANGFNFGDEIPADLTGELPVERNWKKGFMFSITYKLR